MPAKESKRFLVALMVIFLGLFLLVTSGFLAPLVFGFLLTGLTYPLFTELSNKFRGKKNLAALISVVVMILVIILPFLGLLTLLAKEALSLFLGAREQLDVNQPILNLLAPISEKINFDLGAFLEEQIAPALKNLGLILSKEIGGLISNFIKLALNFFVMAMTVFYLLRDGKQFGDFLIRFSPLKTSEELTLYHAFRDAGQAVFLGNFISALVQGILGGIGFALFGIPSPVLWGAIMAFLALIPFLGPYLIFLPAAIYLFATGETGAGMLFLLYNILIVSTVDNFVKPKLIGDRIKIHPLLILIAILGGIKIFGLMGIIYGPLIIAIFQALLRVYLNHSKMENFESPAAS